MKKIIAILLSLALLLGCAAGLAEEAEKQNFGTIRINGVFTLKGILQVSGDLFRRFIQEVLCGKANAVVRRFDPHLRDCIDIDVDEVICRY